MPSTPLARPLARLMLSGVLFALCSSLPGCQLWNAWLDALKWRTDDKPPAVATAQPGTAPIPVPVSGVIPRVTVYRIALPIGSFSSNDKVWSQLNEDAIDSKTAVLMAQNGLRAATGALARWPAISRLLDTPGATTDQIIYQTDGRSSVNVITRPGVTDQMVVSVDRDLQQQGRTFERCDNGFRLSMRAEKKGSTRPELLVQLEPVVTLGTVSVTRQVGEMGVRSTGFTSEESFSDLRMSVPLTSEQFLVVAAMDPNSSPFSVGAQWLSDKDRAPATETVLVFVPVSPTGPAPK